ncbi:MAG: DUF1015 domain-containing protein, partial [Candidatus Omnitrophota bacterium]|nr:DUF1015 domain-containing protein [Candidatus Omnitrophota bacterium]
DKVKDFNKVVSPPYDVISADEQGFYHTLSPYNFTHLDLGQDKASDDQDENKYTRAEKTFQDWLKKGVLLQDEEPAIYFYKQEYKVVGEKYTRLGFISLMELEDEKDSKVFPHENTHAHAVDDRFRLTQALDANLSCIFVCYADQHKKVEKIFNKHILVTKPLVDVTDKDGVRHRLWRLTNPAFIKEINDSVAGQNLFIADGHHRYKVAQQYRQTKISRKANGQEPSNYVMTYFTNIDSRDLQICPMHRIIRHLPRPLDFLEEHFRIDRIANRGDIVMLLAKAGRNEHAFCLYTRNGIKLLRLKNKLLIEQYIKEGSREYKSLDATILKYFILDRIGVKSDDILYTKDLFETMTKVDEGQAQASFILNPVQISQLKAIALNGEKMPPKTTYFYPKVLSGLTVYKME